MDKLVQALANVASWIQIPALVIYILALIFGAYQLYTGEQGKQKGVKTIGIATIGFIIVKLAVDLAQDFSSKVNF